MLKRIPCGIVWFIARALARSRHRISGGSLLCRFRRPAFAIDTNINDLISPTFHGASIRPLFKRRSQAGKP